MRESSQFTADRTLASGLAGCCDFSVVSAGFADTIDTPDEQKRTAICALRRSFRCGGNTSQLHDGLMKMRSDEARNPLQKDVVRI
jgi:hypothetical protein